MPDWNRSNASFRLNFEQQGKRAKELLKAARAGEPEALARFLESPPKLAEAQYLIAKELRLENWAALKRHTAAMTLAREAMSDSVLDGELRTLHIRCGHDLQKSVTDLGRAVLRGEVDFRSLNPPPRWVGGVEVTSSNADWRWDEQRQDAVALRADGPIQVE